MAKHFVATETGYKSELIPEGKRFDAEDDFSAPWAVEVDEDGKPVEQEGKDAIDAVEPEPSKQEDITAAIEPVLPLVTGDAPLPAFHPTAAAAEDHDKVAVAVDAATIGGPKDEEVISTASNPSATPAKKSAKKASDKDGNDLV